MDRKAYPSDLSEIEWLVLAGCRRGIFQPTFAIFCSMFAPLMGLLEQIQPNYLAKMGRFCSGLVLSDKLLGCLSCFQLYPFIVVEANIIINDLSGLFKSGRL